MIFTILPNFAVMLYDRNLVAKIHILYELTKNAKFFLLLCKIKYGIGMRILKNFSYLCSKIGSSL